MALTRKLLKALGIEDEKIEQIIEAHADTVDSFKDKLAAAEEKAANEDELRERISDLERKLEEAKAAADGSEIQAKLDSVQTEYDNYRQSIEQKEARETAQRLYRDALKQQGVQEAHLDLIANDRTTDLESFAIVNGAYENPDAVAEAIQAKYSAYIPQVGAQQGAPVATPPANDGGKSIEDMTQAEYIAWKSKNRGN